VTRKLYDISSSFTLPLPLDTSSHTPSPPRPFLTDESSTGKFYSHSLDGDAGNKEVKLKRERENLNSQ